MDQPVSAEVRRLYETLPFPARDPLRETAADLPVTAPDILAKVNHACFGGRQSFREGFRALVAGGGTGDSAIFLASQLIDTDAEIVCLDLSAASLDIAKRRAELRGLTHIRWVHGSLTDLPRMDLGRFDYVSSLGVLHHLPDPDEGLRALTAALAEGGGMGLMVYGRYGRLDVYAVQDAMRLVNRGVEDYPTKLANLKTVLGSLSPVSLLLRGRSREEIESYLHGDEANAADIFLHPQDRAYTVPELYAYLHGSGLELRSFTNFANVFPIEYDPAVYAADRRFFDLAQDRPPEERHALAELMHGHMHVHAFYAGRPGGVRARFDDPEMTPFFPSAGGEAAALQAIAKGSTEVALSTGAILTIRPSPATRAVAMRIDGERTLGDLCAEIGAAAGFAPEALLRHIAPELDTMHALNWLCLRHAACPAPPNLTYAHAGDVPPSASGDAP